VGTGAVLLARCIVEIRSPATTISIRRSTPGFGSTLTRMTASPRPDPGETAAQGTALAAVHVQAACARTSTRASPPSGGRWSDVANAAS
jgi:hypothetical protein